MWRVAATPFVSSKHSISASFYIYEFIEISSFYLPNILLEIISYILNQILKSRQLFTRITNLYFLEKVIELVAQKVWEISLFDCS